MSKSKPKPKEKVCPICGSTFIAKDPRRIYCSYECLKEHYRQYGNNRRAEDRIHFTKACGICGKEFTTTNRNKLFCSEACARESNRRHAILRRVAEGEAKREKKRKHESLFEIVKEADRRGLTYGEYVSRFNA